MSVNPHHLRIGNWIHCKGSSHYGIVTGDLLALLEKEEKMREKFEGIELNGELLEAAGFVVDQWELLRHPALKCRWVTNDLNEELLDKPFLRFDSSLRAQPFCTDVYYLHHLQNIYLDFVGSELTLPESAKLIPQEVAK